MASVSVTRLWRFARSVRTNVLFSAVVIAWALLCARSASAQSGGSNAQVGFSSSMQGQPALFQPSARPTLRASLSSPAFAAFGSPAGQAQSAETTNNKPDFNRWGITFGSGVDVPIGSNSRTYHTDSVGFQFGVVRYLNRYVGAQLEYDWDFLGVPDSVLANYCTNCSSADAIVNALTLNPVLKFHPNGRFGLYAIGGGGYYWKKTRFLSWSGQEICYPTEGCIPVQSVADSWSSNAFGFNAGGGITCRLGASRVKVFAEGRYTWIDNQTPSSGGGNYPPAYYRTTFIPTVIGIRW
jgi:hypothetical protein